MKPKDVEGNLALIKQMSDVELSKTRKCLVCNGTGKDPVFENVNDNAMPEGVYRGNKVKQYVEKKDVDGKVIPVPVFHDLRCRACKGTGVITLKFKANDENGQLCDCVLIDRYIDRNGALITKFKKLPL